MPKRKAHSFPREDMWNEFWRICEIGLEQRMFGWSDRKMPTLEDMKEKFGLFDTKLNVKIYLNDFLTKWERRHKRDYSVERIQRPDNIFENPDARVKYGADRLIAIYRARSKSDGAFGTFHHIMRTAWYEVHKPKEQGDD